MKDQFYAIVRQGTELLQVQCGYQQNTIAKKLRTLDCLISNAALNLILNKNDKSSLKILKKTAEGIEAPVGQELGMQYDTRKQAFTRMKNRQWQPYVVPEQPDAPNRIVFHPDGRVSVDEKTAFIQGASQEVIEVGVRLNSFANYFISQKEKAYKTHIQALLQRGVNVKGYLLDPDSNEARLYFEDRARVQTFETDSIGEIKKIIGRLKGIAAELNRPELPGKFEIFQYKHLPYAFFYAVDGATEHGKMMVAPYLYGIRRAYCPVMEFHKKDQSSLYLKYWESLRYLTENAKQLI